MEKTMIVKRRNWSKSHSATFSIGLIGLFLLASIFIQSAQSRAVADDEEENGLYSGESTNQHEEQEEQRSNEGCNIFENGPIHALMDRICELCHDMFSHQQPNTRAECRSECFRSTHFKKCLRLFKPGNPQKRRIRTLPPLL